MVRISKRMKASNEKVDRSKALTLAEAIATVTKLPKVKFDETIELHFDLDIDPKDSEQAVRGTTVLPHGTGRKIKIAVFCKSPQDEKAKAAGADYVGAEDLIEKVAGGFMDFDKVVATPDMMRDISKLGKVLGPRGLMPSPKAGTVSMDVDKVIKELKAGKVEFKADKQGDIHIGIGKRSFSEAQLLENAQHLIDAVNHAKPAAVKGILIKSCFLSTTMGPGIRLVL